MDLGVYVINLDEDKKKLQEFSKHLNAQNLKFKRFPGVIITNQNKQKYIDLELLNPGEEIYIPKQYRESDKATRLQTVDAIFNSIGKKATKKERNYYELVLKELEQKEFYSDEAVARMSVEGPEVTTIETRKKTVEPLSERPIETVETEQIIEPIPEEVDAVSRLQERIAGDFEGVLARQQDVGRARNNVGNISQSIMRLKSLGG